MLDHVAVAVEAWSEAWPAYVGRLGGEWASGGQGIGFAPAQLRFANEARLEVLQPWAVERNSFLRRFLDQNGPGPHHLTFKVPDLAEALRVAEAAGFEPVAVDLSDPGWLEAFLHPRQATGVVVQLAQAAGSWQSPEPEGFPSARPRHRAALRHVTHAVADLEQGLVLFRDLLGGRELSRADAPDGSWRSITLGWSGPLRLRLVSPSPGAAPDTALHEWLAGRSGRIHHVAFAQPGIVSHGADGVPGVADAEGPVEVVEPERNFGVRLVVHRSGDARGSR